MFHQLQQSAAGTRRILTVLILTFPTALLIAMTITSVANAGFGMGDLVGFVILWIITSAILFLLAKTYLPNGFFQSTTRIRCLLLLIACSLPLAVVAGMTLKAASELGLGLTDLAHFAGLWILIAIVVMACQGRSRRKTEQSEPIGEAKKDATTPQTKIAIRSTNFFLADEMNRGGWPDRKWVCK